jgi:hypothetical protein
MNILLHAKRQGRGRWCPVFGMKDNAAFKLVFGIVLSGLCGCASSPRKSTEQSHLYQLTVKFISPAGEVVQQIKTLVRPDLPFSLNTKDQAGNDYHVKGTLREKPNGAFQFEPIAVGLGLKSGFSQSSHLEPVLGQAWRMRTIPNGYDDSIELTRN